MIQKGHEPFVHHMNVYKCRKPHKYIGREYECYHLPIRDMELVPCGNVVAGWAVGSGVRFTCFNTVELILCVCVFFLFCLFVCLFCCCLFCNDHITNDTFRSCSLDFSSFYDQATSN